METGKSGSFMVVFCDSNGYLLLSYPDGLFLGFFLLFLGILVLNNF